MPLTKLPTEHCFISTNFLILFLATHCCTALGVYYLQVWEYIYLVKPKMIWQNSYKTEFKLYLNSNIPFFKTVLNSYGFKRGHFGGCSLRSYWIALCFTERFLLYLVYLHMCHDVCLWMRQHNQADRISSVTPWAGRTRFRVHRCGVVTKSCNGRSIYRRNTCYTVLKTWGLHLSESVN